METLFDARRNIDKLIRKVKSEMFLEHLETCLSDNFTPQELESQRMQEFISQLIEK
jgi:DNA-binding FrmR family transcriptional regulator